MMSKMRAMFVLLLLFTLASSQQEGDVQARKTSLKSDFYRALRKYNKRECVFDCGTDCSGSCSCDNAPFDWCSCSGPTSKGCKCTCRCRNPTEC
uniref:Conotoxin superfamily S n=1 Tax=Conus magus TaxID=6492 RepID=A0A5P8I0T1_CONMA|nr:conotoxin superfamily S [Conus magus]